MAQAIDLPTSCPHPPSSPLAPRLSSDIQEHDSPLDNQSHLQEFKNNVQIPHHKLVELAQNDQYGSETQDFNRKALELINEGYISEACILLSQAEKVLQYAANRGKEISRDLIVTVLHNQAFCHQQSWNLERCANYVEALIYNLNCEIKQTQNACESGLIVIESIQLRNSLAQYYLLFCAINSQLKRNDAALIAAKKGNSLLKSNSSLLFKIATKSRIQIDHNTMKLLEELSILQCSSQNLTVKKLLSATSYFYGIWKNKCAFPNNQLRHLIDKLKDFSIGNIMQMEPLEYRGDSQGKVLNLSLQEMLERVVTVSISYFTMATELRLLATRFAGSKEQAKELSQYRQSQYYHLIAIILILYYLPFDLLYLRHILTSFRTHYQVDIEELEPFSNHSTSPQEMFQLLLTQTCKDEEYKASTAGNSQKAQSSSRNSHQEKNMPHSKLQSYVRASLKGQQPSNQKELAKLNNYYYMQGELAASKQKVFKQISNRSTHKDAKSNKKRAFLTSKHSTQKTPVGHTPGQLSPKRSKCSSKSSRGGSKRGSIDHTKIHDGKKISVMQEYFDYQVQRQEPKRPHLRQKSKKKSDGSKENRDYIGFNKLKEGLSPSTHLWRGSNLMNDMTGRDKSNEVGQIKMMKSTSRLKGKLLQAKSKKKAHLHK